MTMKYDKLFFLSSLAGSVCLYSMPVFVCQCVHSKMGSNSEIEQDFSVVCKTCLELPWTL